MWNFDYVRDYHNARIQKENKERERGREDTNKNGEHVLYNMSICGACVFVSVGISIAH